MASKNQLEIHRKRIDLIDQKLLNLLSKRAQEAQRIGRIKAKSGEQVFVSDREREVLDAVIDRNKGPLSDEAVEDIYQTILTACRSLQRRMSIAYFGPEATFTHQAAIHQFGRDAEYTAVPSIKDVFAEVDRGRVNFGVVPIENSTEGMVNHTLDMFIDSELQITAERQDRISHNLLSLSGSISKVKTVYSHPQALAQCRRWLDARLSQATVHEAASTADAAIQATLDASCAAIASDLAGRMYHLKTVAMGIEDTPDNATRFLTIGRTSPPPTGRDKTSILVSVKDRVGALYTILAPFRAKKLNLTKIESRPTKKKAWEYLFFIDFIGHQSEGRVRSALDALRRQTKFVKVLGSYPYGA